jgi:hypothetical protein
MTILLLANIGNRDVWVDKDAPIPGDVHPLWNQKASRRALGEALQQNWTECRPYLSLPIIGKAVDHILQQEERIDYVVLVSTDQSRNEGVSEHHLAQDTCKLAWAIEHLLDEVYGSNVNAIMHRTVQGNPADYGEMEAFFQQHLPELRKQYRDGIFYLEVSGGTPAMTSMLLTVGAEVFGLDARPLYISEHEEDPFSLDLGRRTVAESLKRVVRENADIYAYHAAAQTVRDNLDLLRDFAPADTLLAVLEYARKRINFNFDQALEVLRSVPHDQVTDRLEQLADDLHPDQMWWLLHEIVYNAEVRLEVGAYGDFLVRLFRFDEATRRYTANRLGARFVDWNGNLDDDGELVDLKWLESKPALEEYFDEKDVNYDHKGRVRATRFVMDLLISFLAREMEKKEPQILLKRLGKIYQLVNVRNQSFATHTFDGITRDRMVRAFTGRPDASGTDEALEKITSTVREACQLATGRGFEPPSPYQTINDLINDLLTI